MIGPFVSPSRFMLKPHPQCDGVWRRGLGEVLRLRRGREGAALTV